MKLHRVHIKNYRSIRDITIDFDPSCRVLVGINESGKSNILRALRLLGDNYKPASADDVREALPNENPVTESFVWFAFKLEKAEADQVYDTVSQLVISADVSSKIVGNRGRTQSLKELCVSRDEVLYHHAQYWAFDNRAKLFPGWKKPAGNSPQDNAFEHNGHSYQLSKYKLIRAKDFPDIPLGYLENARINDLLQIIGGAILQSTQNKRPEPVFWQYDEANLLPNSATIPELYENPESCVPLMNMFNLAGITDIKPSIEKARQGTNNQFQNYLDGVAKKDTNNFRNVWKEYKNVEFSLRLNSD